MSLLQVINIRKHYDGVSALDDLSFTVAQGEILGLMGANGAGKTTAFSLIAGTQSPTGGEIRFDGERIDGRRPHEICRRGVARTFQIVRPFGGLSVRENVTVAAWHGHARARSRAAATATADEIIAEVGLANQAAMLAETLTLPDRKRLEVARALATGPRLLLLDEVLAGLTPSEVVNALAMIQALHRRHQLTLIVIEHVMHALMQLCERIVVLHHGRKIAEGPPAQIVEDPDVIAAYFGKHRP